MQKKEFIACITLSKDLMKQWKPFIVKSKAKETQCDPFFLRFQSMKSCSIKSATEFKAQRARKFQSDRSKESEIIDSKSWSFNQENPNLMPEKGEIQ